MAASPADIRASAERLFGTGLYCAESVVLAIAHAQGVQSESVPKMATAFCSGVSRTCGMCGALAGGVMGVGLALGRSQPAESVQPAYAATQQLIAAFEREFGSRDCRALLDGCDLNTPEGQAMFREREFGRRCLQYTGRAAELSAEAIAASR
jgi:C_GCAxxG_C_C family probable redox protein